MPALTRAGRTALARATAGQPFDFGAVPVLGRRGGFGPKLSFRVTTQGMERALATLEQIGGLAAAAADQVLGEESRAAADRIRERWPVDTGLSRGRWIAAKVRQGKVSRWLVTNDVPHAKYVHRKGDPTVLVESLVPAEIGRARDRISRRIRRLLRTRIASLSRGQAMAITRAGRAFLR